MPIREVKLSFKEVQEKIKHLEHKYKMSSADFDLMTDKERILPEDDAYNWAVLLDHRKALLEGETKKGESNKNAVNAFATLLQIPLGATNNEEYTAMKKELSDSLTAIAIAGGLEDEWIEGQNQAMKEMLEIVSDPAFRAYIKHIKDSKQQS